MSKTAKTVVLNCQHCGKEIDDFTRVFEHAPKYCRKCAYGTWEEKQEAVPGGFKMWEVSLAGKTKHERVWCPACKIDTCEKGLLKQSGSQCSHCGWLINEATKGEILPGGAIQVSGFIWFPDCSSCFTGHITTGERGYLRWHSRKEQCEKCFRKNEDWLHAHMRTPLRYTIRRSSGPKMVARFLLDKEERDALDTWYREHSQSKKGIPRDTYRLRRKGEEEKILVMDIDTREPQREPVVVYSFCTNKLTNKIEYVTPEPGKLALDFSSLAEAQEYVARKMGKDLKQFWL